MQELNGRRWGRSPRLGLNTFYKRFLVTDGSPSVFSDIRAGNFWIFSTPSMNTISIRIHPHDVSQVSPLPHRPHLHTPFRGDPHFKNQCWENINSQSTAGLDVSRMHYTVSGDGEWQKPQPLALPGLHKTVIMAIKDDPREQGTKLYMEDKSPETQGWSLLQSKQ